MDRDLVGDLWVRRPAVAVGMRCRDTQDVPSGELERPAATLITDHNLKSNQIDSKSNAVSTVSIPMQVARASLAHCTTVRAVALGRCDTPTAQHRCVAIFPRTGSKPTRD